MPGDLLAEMFIKIEADMNSLKQSFNQVEGEVQSFGQKLGGMMKGFIPIAAITAAAAGFTKLMTSAASFGEEISLMNEKTGLSVELIQELGYAAEESGASLGNLDSVTKRLAVNLQKAFEGNQAAIKSLEDLGLSISELQAMNPDQRFMAIARAIGGIQDPTKRSAEAVKLLGQAGNDLIPLMTNLDDLIQKYKDAGIILTSEEIANLQAGAKAMDDMSRNWEALQRKFAATVFPNLQPFLDRLAEASESFAKVFAWLVKLDERAQGGIFNIKQPAWTQQKGIFDLISGGSAVVPASAGGGPISINVGNFMGDEQSLREFSRQVGTVLSEEDRRSNYAPNKTEPYQVGGHL